MANKVQDQIASLEREVALKKAYSSALIKLPKGLPEDVVNEVITKLQEFAIKLASGEFKSESYGFSQEEVEILKTMAKSVKNKIKQEKELSPKSAPEQPVTKRPDDIAMVLMTDNIDATVRSYVSSGDLVKIRGVSGEYVTAITKAGHVFRIPYEDLDFNPEQ